MIKLVIRALLEKSRKSPRLIPKKIFVTREGSRYETTVWVSPDEEKKETTSRAQFDLFEDAKMSEKTQKDVDKKVAIMIPSNQVNENARRLLMDGITYKFALAGHPLDGKTLTGGVPDTYQGKRVVRFDRTNVAGKMVTPMINVETRPDLDALVAEYKAEVENERSQREAKWKREAEEERNKKLERAAELQVAEEEGWTVCVFDTYEEIPGTDGYGWSIYETPDGRKIKLDNDVECHKASDETQGAFGYTLYLAIKDVDAVISRQANKKADEAKNESAIQEEKRAAWHKRRAELLSAKIPQSAIDDYNRYRGSAERAWEAEDEAAWAAIDHWAPYIEEQIGIHPQALKEHLAEAAREEHVDQE